MPPRLHRRSGRRNRVQTPELKWHAVLANLVRWQRQWDATSHSFFIYPCVVGSAGAAMKFLVLAAQTVDLKMHTPCAFNVGNSYRRNL